MNFKDLARTKVNLQLQSNFQAGGNTPTAPFTPVIEAINQELASPGLEILIDFIKEYHGTLEFFYGFLFEPYDELGVFHPKMQKTRNRKSPYFCLKIPVKKMGNIFLIPLDELSQSQFVLVLKPDRLLRQSVKVNNVLFFGASTTAINQPYEGLMEYLTQWSVVKEASLRNVL